MCATDLACLIATFLRDLKAFGNETGLDVGRLVTLTTAAFPKHGAFQGIMCCPTELMYEVCFYLSELLRENGLFVYRGYPHMDSDGNMKQTGTDRVSYLNLAYEMLFAARISNITNNDALDMIERALDIMGRNGKHATSGKNRYAHASIMHAFQCLRIPWEYCNFSGVALCGVPADKSVCRKTKNIVLVKELRDVAKNVRKTIGTLGTIPLTRFDLAELKMCLSDVKKH